MANGPDILNWPRGPDAMDCASARWSAVRVLSLSLGRRGDCMSAMDVSSSKNGRGAPSLVIVLSLSRRWAGGHNERGEGGALPALLRLCLDLGLCRTFLRWLRRGTFGGWRALRRHQAGLLDLPHPIIPGAAHGRRPQLVRRGELGFARRERIHVT